MGKITGKIPIKDFIIDKSKSGHFHIPPGLEGQVLLEECFHEDGTRAGVIAIEPETLKWLADNKTAPELVVMGYAQYMGAINYIKTRQDIQAVEPPLALPEA